MADYAFTPFTRAAQGGLFPAEIPTEFAHSARLRTYPVDGTAMSPTLNNGDFVILAPVTTYCQEGVYLISDGGEPPHLCRVQRWNGADQMRLVHDAAPHSPWFTTRARFDESVLGLVVAEVKVTRPAFIRRVMDMAA